MASSGIERVEIHDAGAIEILKSAAVRDFLTRMGESIATAAEASGKGKWDVEQSTTATRARVRVICADIEARKAEAKDRTLLKALEAGRE